MFIRFIRNIRFFRNIIATVKIINRRYAKPHIKMTPFVKFSLLMLRGYLLFLVGILVYKFITKLY